GIHGEMDKLRNASLILEEYFSSVNQQLNADTKLIKTAGILSLFRNIDLKYTQTIIEIEKYFQVSKNELIENLELLYKYEIADELNGSYKVADQILGEYIFFLVFIKQKQLSFGLLLDLYIDENKFSLIKLLNPIVANYGFEEVRLLIINDIKRKWDSLSNESKSWKFLKDFWFYLPTESLMFVSRVVSIKNATDLNNLPFQIYNDNQLESYQDHIIEILVNFQQFTDKFTLALDLLVKYGLSEAFRFTKLLKVFTQSFTYGRYDYSTNYGTQIKLFEYLYDKVHKEDEIFYSKIILFIAHKYLIDSFQSNYSDGLTMYFGQIPIYLSDAHKEFRTKLWNFIFDCHRKEALRDDVYNFFERHRYEHHYHKNNAVVEFDKKLIINFFNNFLPDPDFRETEIVYDYLKMLGFSKISFDKRLKGKFKNKEYDLWYLLNERAENKIELLYRYVENFSIEDYRVLLEQINLISKYKKNHFLGYSTMKDSISHIFIKLANSDFELFLDVLELLFHYEYSNHLYIGLAFKNLEYNNYKSQKIRALILEKKIASSCIIPFLSFLPAKYIVYKDYETFISFFRNEKTVWINFIEEIFIKFENIEIDIEKELNSLLDYLMRKSVSTDFYIHNDFFKYLYTDYNHIFLNRLDDIQTLYLTLDEKDRHFDYGLDLLKLILRINPKFICNLLEATFEDKTFLRRDDFLGNDFKRLWDLENRNEIFEDILVITSKFPSPFVNVRSEVSVIFQGSGDLGLHFLYYLVNKTDDEHLLRLIFNIVLSQFNESKYDFLNILLTKKTNIEFFKKLDFYSGSVVTSGSRIPKIRHEITVYEELRNYILNLNDIKYLEHLNCIEHQIDLYNAEIEWERKREFLDEWSI
ncbi:MAG: hypothetical protein PW786_09700, partial [Arachidicoccus sp.]|nr:hypothetical protein [Arachidicoccus sp.]